MVETLSLVFVPVVGEPLAARPDLAAAPPARADWRPAARRNVSPPGTSILISLVRRPGDDARCRSTAAVLLHATPTQMGLLTFMEIVPFVLFSLPSGVWLDRVRKLPVYIVGELGLALVVVAALAWATGWLGMTWLYVVGSSSGTVSRCRLGGADQRRSSRATA